MSDESDIFEQALSAASDAFLATIDEHFGRSDDAAADEKALGEEYRAAASLLRDSGRALKLRTGLIDADFTCWLSGFADENFGDGVEP